jgi:hypothetical protein
LIVKGRGDAIVAEQKVKSQKWGLKFCDDFLSKEYLATGLEEQ